MKSESPSEAPQNAVQQPSEMEYTTPHSAPLASENSREMATSSCFSTCFSRRVLQWAMRDSNKPAESREIRKSVAARSKNVATLDDLSPFDPELLAVVQAWPELLEATKVGILAMVRAADGDTK